MKQTASSASVTLMIPEIARSLEISELEAQWVVSAYSLAYGW
jgi:predicted MFS family arabinose efflux permease